MEKGKRTEYFKQYMAKYRKEHKEQIKKINAEHYAKRKAKELNMGDITKIRLTEKRTVALLERAKQKPEERQEIIKFVLDWATTKKKYSFWKDRAEQILNPPTF